MGRRILRFYELSTWHFITTTRSTASVSNKVVLALLLFLYWSSDRNWSIFCGNGSIFCILVLVLLITFLMASSIIDGDTTLFRDSDLFFCCSSWYILAGIFSAPKNWLLWDVEGSVGVLWNFDGTLSGEKGNKPVAAKPLLIFGKERAFLWTAGWIWIKSSFPTV